MKDEILGRRQFVATSAVALLAGCSSEGSNTTDMSTSATDEGTSSTDKGSSEKQSSSNDTESTEKQKKERKTATVPVGKVVKDDSLAMVVRKVTKKSQLDEFDKAKSGNTYVVVRMAAKNTSGEYVDFNSFLQAKIKDGSNHVYDSSLSSTDHPIQSGVLAPGEVARGDVVFEVPKSASGLSLQFDFSTFDLFEYKRVTISLGKKANSIVDLKQSLGLDIHSTGKKVSHEDVSVVVHGVRTASKLGEFTSAKDGHQYVIPDIEITNNTGKPLTVSTLLQMRVKTGDGLSYTDDIGGSSSLDQAYNEASDIAAGQSRRGELAYQVKTDAKPLYWVFNFLNFDAEFKAFWKLR